MRSDAIPVGYQYINVGGKTIEIPIYSSGQLPPEQRNESVQRLARLETERQYKAQGLPPPKFEEKEEVKVTVKEEPKVQIQEAPKSPIPEVVKYHPSQAFTYSSIEGRYIPTGSPLGTPGTVSYQQLPESAKRELEAKGIISSAEAPPSIREAQKQVAVGVVHAAEEPKPKEAAQVGGIPFQRVGEKEFYKTSEGKFVPVPFTEQEFVKTSLEAESYEQFRTRTLGEAAQYYQVGAAKLKAEGKEPEPMESYLKEVEAKVTPEFHQGLIAGAYPVAVEKAVLSEQGQALPRLTREELQQAYRKEELEKYFESEIREGRLPIGLQAASVNIAGVTIKNIGASVLDVAGQKQLAQEFRESAIKEQASVLSRAAIMGSEGRHLEFAVSQIPETFTGIAGVSVGAGAVMGGAVSGAGTLIRVGAPTSAAAKVTTGIGKFVAEHPKETALIIGGAYIGAETLKAKGELEAGVPVPEVSAGVGKSVVGAVSFGYGFKGGFEGTKKFLEAPTGKDKIFIKYTQEGVVMKEAPEGEPIEIASEVRGGVVKVVKAQTRAEALLKKSPKTAEYPFEQAAFTKATEIEAAQVTKYMEGGKVKTLKTISKEIGRTTEEGKVLPELETKQTVSLRSDKTATFKTLKEEPFYFEDESKIVVGAKQVSKETILMKGGKSADVYAKGYTRVGVAKKSPLQELAEPEAPTKPSLPKSDENMLKDILKRQEDLRFGKTPIPSEPKPDLLLEQPSPKPEPIAKLGEKSFRQVQEAGRKAAVERAKEFYDKVYSPTGEEAASVPKIRTSLDLGKKSFLDTKGAGKLRPESATVSLPKSDVKSILRTGEKPRPKETPRISSSTVALTRPETVTGQKPKLEVMQKLRTDVVTETPLLTTGRLRVPPNTPITPFVPLGRISKGGSTPSGRRGGRQPKLRLPRMAKEFRKGKAPGIVSESISKAMFGKATAGKEAGSLTKEMERAGLSVGKFYLKGGFGQKFRKGRRK